MTSPDHGSFSRRTAAINGDMLSCRLCQRSVTAQALFCDYCGTVQPSHQVDHFTRFGLEQRFDLDLEALARRHERFQRALDPLRFIAKSPGERADAQLHAAALGEAYDTLKDPIRRARYLLTLLGVTVAEGEEAETLLDPTILDTAIGRAAEPSALDRLANQATREIESCIRDLSAAFRADQVTAAAQALARLQRLEAVASEARLRRAAL